MEKNFILGVGCQKGGTSWLHSQLDKSNHTDFGFLKEYHVFDVLDVPECKFLLRRKLVKLAASIRNKGDLTSAPNYLKHLSFYQNPDNYYDYFDYLWYRGKGKITTVGDITPSYCALPKRSFKKIKSNLEKRGFNVKVIFIIRDPIERCWSSVRMYQKNRKIKYPNMEVPSEEFVLKNYYNSRDYKIRTQYEKTIKNLEKVFKTKDIFYALYENLFEEQTISELATFLNLSDFDPDIKQMVNVSPKDKRELNLDEELGRNIFDTYKKTYEFCDKRFGTKEIWRGWEYES